MYQVNVLGDEMPARIKGGPFSCLNEPIEFGKTGDPVQDEARMLLCLVACAGG